MIVAFMEVIISTSAFMRRWMGSKTIPKCLSAQVSMESSGMFHSWPGLGRHFW